MPAKQGGRFGDEETDAKLKLFDLCSFNFLLKFAMDRGGSLVLNVIQYAAQSEWIPKHATYRGEGCTGLYDFAHRGCKG